MLLYTTGPTGRWIQCHLCDMTSTNPNDVKNHFCGHCGVFLDDLEQAADMYDQTFGMLALVNPPAPRTVEFFREVVDKLNGRGSSTPSS